MRFRAFRAAEGAPLGSHLLGALTDMRSHQVVRVQTLITVVVFSVNALGAVQLILLDAWVLPGHSVLASGGPILNYGVAVTYMAVGVIVGKIWVTLKFRNTVKWWIEGRRPTRAQQVAALELPGTISMITGLLWLGAAILFTGSALMTSPYTALIVLFGITFTGLWTSTFSYLASEFAMRGVAASAIEAGDPGHVRLPRASRRTVLAWILGSGLPVAGLIMVAGYTYVEPATTSELAVAVLVISTISLIAGTALTVVSVRAALDPVRSVSEAMSKIAAGDFDARVIVYDGSELGELQSGFNRMAEGLQERERIQEVFGHHVGHEVAAAALEKVPELGGEERSVAAFFIDIVGSTAMAFARPPQEVVTLLNRFFDVVVDEVDRHSGMINKFEGDAALAIFGAPVDLDDPAGQALAAARAIAKRLPIEVAECQAAIGVSYGVAVAGNIGARNRFEYTVIGDPINEAARLCELAKTKPGMVLASATTQAAAGPDEASRWTLGDEVTLRGRSAPTRLAFPSSTKPAAANGVVVTHGSG